MLSLSAWRQRAAERPSDGVITAAILFILLADSKFPQYFKQVLTPYNVVL